MFDRALNMLLISVPQRKYNAKFSKGRPECCKRKQEKSEFDERNAWNNGKNFIFYIFLTRNRSSRPAHHYE